MMLKRIILLFSLLSLALSLSAQEENTLPNGAASGDTTQFSTFLWTRSTEIGLVNFELSTDANFSQIISTLTAEVTDPLVPVKVHIQGLTPNTPYYYRVTDAAGTTAQGRFRTSAEPNMQRGLRFGVTGDWRGELAPYPAISNADERDLELFILLGDTIYADFPSPDVPLEQAETLEDYRLKQSEVYSSRHDLNAWADLRASTSLLVTIDDHEVTNDFSGGASPESDPRFADFDGDYINDAPLYENGMQAFLDYNPVQNWTYGQTDDPRMSNEWRLYRYHTYGKDAAVIVLDNRSFRDEPLPGVTEFNQEPINQFLAASFDPARTMLGGQQLADLKNDLSDAQARGTIWKFVVVAEPIQNLGPVGASDRFEGYAAERTEILKHIAENNITNVVFISADIHGTLVNNLTYQEALGGEQIPTGAFEITTGSAAFAPPFGPTVFQIASDLGFLTEQQQTLYTIAPLAGKEIFMSQLINGQIEPFGYSPLGLEDSGLAVELISGAYLATHTFGWTEFEIAPETAQLRVTTYGIPWYSEEELAANPTEIVARVPQVVSEFTVNPALD